MLCGVLLGKAFALQVANQGPIPGLTYGPWHSSRHRAGVSNPFASPGVVPKPEQLSTNTILEPHKYRYTYEQMDSREY